MKKSSFFLFFIITGILIIGCKTLQKAEYNPLSGIADKKICILYHPTVFRDQIVKNLIDRLSDKNIHISVDDSINEKKYDPVFFDLVIVISGSYQLIPDYYPAEFIAKHKDDIKVLLVLNTYLTKKGVIGSIGGSNNRDTITGASLPEKDLTEIIYDEIMKRL
jgi:hypothetical protein